VAKALGCWSAPNSTDLRSFGPARGQGAARNADHIAGLRVEEGMATVTHPAPFRQVDHVASGRAPSCGPVDLGNPGSKGFARAPSAPDIRILFAPDVSDPATFAVENDCYTAFEFASALRGAGGEIIDPSPKEEMTASLLETASPSFVDLGGGEGDHA